MVSYIEAKKGAASWILGKNEVYDCIYRLCHKLLQGVPRVICPKHLSSSFWIKAILPFDMDLQNPHEGAY